MTLRLNLLHRYNFRSKLFFRLDQAEKKVLNESYTGATDSISRSFNIEGSTTPFHITEQHNKTVNNGTIREIGNKLSHNNIRTVVVKTDIEFDNLYAEWEELCEDADVHIFQR